MIGYRDREKAYSSLKNSTFFKKGMRMKQRAILFAPNFVLLVLLTICTTSGVSAHIRSVASKWPPSGHFYHNSSKSRLGASLGVVNLALNKHATASSLETTQLGAGNAVDGNLTTRWSSGPRHGTEWLQIDLGSAYVISGVNLAWERAYATIYQI